MPPPKQEPFEYPTPDATPATPTRTGRAQAVPETPESPTPASRRQYMTGGEFNYKTYDPSPEVAYTADPAEAETLFSRSKGPVLGLGVYWHYAGKWQVEMYRRNGTVEDTSLIVMCDKDLIVLYHLRKNTSKWMYLQPLHPYC